MRQWFLFKRGGGGGQGEEGGKERQGGESRIVSTTKLSCLEVAARNAQVIYKVQLLTFFYFHSDGRETKQRLLTKFSEMI